MTDDLQIDHLLRTALPAKPEVCARIDVAAAAMERARAYDVRAVHLKKIAWGIRISSVAAAVLFILTLAATFYLYPKDSTASSISSGTSLTPSSDDALNGTESGSSLDMCTISLFLLTAAVVGVSVKTVLSSDRGSAGLSPPPVFS